MAYDLCRGPKLAYMEGEKTKTKQKLPKTQGRLELIGQQNGLGANNVGGSLQRSKSSRSGNIFFRSLVIGAPGWLSRLSI